MLPVRALALCVVMGCWSQPLRAQDEAVDGAAAGGIQQPPPNVQGKLTVPRFNCPGDPPGNLAAFDCSFTMGRRVEHFITSSITDQAVLGAVITGLFAHLRDDPPEWDTGLDGFGRRVGSRYERRIVGGLAELAVGAIMQSDPRHVTYASDPLITNPRGGPGARIRHAVVDWLTVRRSAQDAKGRHLPNLPLLASAVANGLAGQTWYPKRLRTGAEVLQRAAGPLQTALLGSFYAEFSPEIGRMLGAMFRRGVVPSPTRNPRQGETP
jgi:hypothetical protein